MCSNMLILTNVSLHFRAADTIIRNLPEMRKAVLDTLQIVFMPKEIATQLVLAIALQTSMVRNTQLYSEIVLSSSCVQSKAANILINIILFYLFAYPSLHL